MPASSAAGTGARLPRVHGSRPVKSKEGPMAELLRTLFHGRHAKLGATLVEFGGWEMPVQYPAGIVQEHLATRRRSGLFDVSHMGRFRVAGGDAPAFLQHVLTNNAAALSVGKRNTP